jgi:hypothetical protein
MTLPNSMLAFFGGAPGSLPAWRDNELIAALLILVLGIALGIVAACLCLVAHSLRSGRLVGYRSAWRMDPRLRDRRFHPTVFELPPRWMAIRTGNPRLVQVALGLHNPTACSWEEGLAAAHENKLFISPAVNGWVLVMGSDLPEPAEDVDKCFHFLTELSRKLGQVQFFSTNRVVNHHAWAQAEQGRVQRAYAWAGATLWNQGKMTKAEIDLGLKCLEYGSRVERGELLQMAALAVNTERVPLLAARWSVDPTTLDARKFRESPGIAGALSRSRTH